MSISCAGCCPPPRTSSSPAGSNWRQRSGRRGYSACGCGNRSTTASSITGSRCPMQTVRPLGALRAIDRSPGVDDLVRALLTALGEHPERQGLLDTPQRVSKSLAFLTAGYGQDPREVLGTAIFEEQYD